MVVPTDPAGSGDQKRVDMKTYERVYAENVVGEKVIDFYRCKDDPRIQIQVLRTGFDYVDGYSVDFYDAAFVKRNTGTANIDVVRTLREAKAVVEDCIAKGIIQ